LYKSNVVSMLHVQSASLMLAMYCAL